MKQKKAFISYSHSSTEHQEWVIKLATDLRENGIDATLDVWDLAEGQDVVEYMEKMVNDPNIDKVIIVSDRVYVEKSKNRDGGVGIETRLITSEIFNQQDGTKFVVLVRELEESGEPSVPAFYKPRKYMDFTNDTNYNDNLKALIHNIADVPINKKPELGDLPAYLTVTDNATALQTSVHHRRAINSLMAQSSDAYFLTKQYFDALIDCMEQFRLPRDFDPTSDVLTENIDTFLPYRKEYSDIIESIASNSNDSKYGDAIHKFFESAHGFCHPTQHMQPSRSIDFDNYKFFFHEMFLHTIAIFIRESRSDLFKALVEQPYYTEQMRNSGNDEIASFALFRDYLWSFDKKNADLNLRRISIPADLIRDRSESQQIFNGIVETDFILYLRSHMTDVDYCGRWYPDTIAYTGRNQSTLEIFRRSQSRRYFDSKVSPLFMDISVERFKSFVEEVAVSGGKFSDRIWHPISITKLTGCDNLGTLK